MPWLRRLEEGRHIPIMVITGGNPMVDKNRPLAAGAIVLFYKPIDSAVLLLTLNRTVSRNAEAEQAGSAPSLQA